VSLGRVDLLYVVLLRLLASCTLCRRGRCPFRWRCLTPSLGSPYSGCLPSAASPAVTKPSAMPNPENDSDFTL
jgi:hypothetical protein